MLDYAHRIPSFISHHEVLLDAINCVVLIMLLFSLGHQIAEF